MACFFCKHFKGNRNRDDSIAGYCHKFQLRIEERIAHEDCSFYATKDKTCINCIHKDVCYMYRLNYIGDREGYCTNYYEEPKKGSWIDSGDVMEEYRAWGHCSVCGGGMFQSDFCPDCGADMREADNDNNK